MGDHRRTLIGQGMSEHAYEITVACMTLAAFDSESGDDRDLVAAVAALVDDANADDLAQAIMMLNGFLSGAWRLVREELGMDPNEFVRTYADG